MRQSFVMIPGRSFVFQAPLALLLAVSAVEFAVQVAWSSPVSVRGITIDRFGATMGMLVSLIGLTCIRYADRQLEGHPKKDRDRKSTRLNSSHSQQSRMPSSA